MYTLMIKGKFDSAHSLPDYEGKCKNVHGHTWHIKAGFEYKDLYHGGPRNGMGEDFIVLKQQLGWVEDSLDHRLVNDVVVYPTAENIAEWIFHAWRPINEHLVWIEIWETEGAGVRYEPTKREWPEPTKEAYAPIHLGGNKDEP